MRTAAVFVVGLMIGVAVASTGAQTRRPMYLNHVGIAVPDMEKAVAFYTKQMGLKEGFVLRNDKGERTLTYLHWDKETFVELNPVTPERPAGLSHYGLVLPDLRAQIATWEKNGLKFTPVGTRFADSANSFTTDLNGMRIELFEFGPNSLQGKAISAYK